MVPIVPQVIFLTQEFIIGVMNSISRLLTESLTHTVETPVVGKAKCKLLELFVSMKTLDLK